MTTKKTAKKTAAAAVTATVSYEDGIAVIPLKDITVLPEGNTTRPEGPGEVTDLMASLQALGQQVPVVVARDGEGFRLVAGFRRMAALTALNVSTVQARVLANAMQAVVANVSENENSRKDISPLGRLAGYDALQAQGYTIAEVAAITGRAEDFIRDHMRIAKGADEVRAALALPEGEEGSCSWAVARLILRFAKAEQPMLLKKVGHMTVAKAREALAAYRAGKADGGAPSKGSKGSGGEGGDEGDEGEVEAGLDAEKVANATLPFVALVGDTVAALRSMLDGPTPDIASALKVVNALAKGTTKQENTMRKLVGDEIVEAIEKSMAKALKEASKAA